MTNQEIVNRSGLDIRDAEPDDYAALYSAIQIIAGLKEKENNDG